MNTGMNKMEKEKREGFWWSKYEPKLPKVKHEQTPWKGKALFLADLRRVQSKAATIQYRGWSNCRCCKQANGTMDYRYNGWTWPEGYEHYIQQHNVQPTPEFKAFIEEKVKSKRTAKADTTAASKVRMAAKEILIEMVKQMPDKSARELVSILQQPKPDKNAKVFCGGPEQQEKRTGRVG